MSRRVSMTVTKGIVDRYELVMEKIAKSPDHLAYAKFRINDWALIGLVDKLNELARELDT